MAPVSPRKDVMSKTAREETELGYRRNLRELQIELVKFQRQLIKRGDRILVLIEGRDRCPVTISEMMPDTPRPAVVQRQRSTWCGNVGFLQNNSDLLRSLPMSRSVASVCRSLVRNNP